LGAPWRCDYYHVSPHVRTAKAKALRLFSPIAARRAAGRPCGPGSALPGPQRSRSRGGGRGGLDHLDVELDADPLTDGDAAGLEQLVPAQAEVAPVDRGPGAEGEALVAPLIEAAAAVLDLELDLAGDVADGELAAHDIVLVAA